MTDAAEVSSIVEAIRPILAHHPVAVQGAALADLLAIWLAGHHVPGDEHETRMMRAELLSLHCSLVRRLVPVNARHMGTTP